LGAREVFLAAVALFTVASAARGLAATVQQPMTFRVVQGIGGDLTAPVGMAMLYRTFPPSDRVRLSRIINIPIALAPAARRSARCWADSLFSGPAGDGSSGSTYCVCGPAPTNAQEIVIDDR
jgi:MFS family permease